MKKKKRMGKPCVIIVKKIDGSALPVSIHNDIGNYLKPSEYFLGRNELKVEGVFDINRWEPFFQKIAEMETGLVVIISHPESPNIVVLINGNGGFQHLISFDNRQDILKLAFYPLTNLNDKDIRKQLSSFLERKHIKGMFGGKAVLKEGLTIRCLNGDILPKDLKKWSKICLASNEYQISKKRFLAKLQAQGIDDFISNIVVFSYNLCMVKVQKTDIGYTLSMAVSYYGEFYDILKLEIQDVLYDTIKARVKEPDLNKFDFTLMLKMLKLPVKYLI